MTLIRKHSWHFLWLFLCHSFGYTQTLVGSLPGEFSVDRGGAANYNLSIDVPPGIGDFQPTLALTYRSQSGLAKLGVGWQLDGMQSIFRCSQTRVHEGEGFKPGVHFTHEDRYCLNGERLLTDGVDGEQGTTYVTETDKWLRIRSGGGSCGQGPCAFYVTDAQGIEYGFGSASDASLFRALGREEILHYPLTSMTDRNGNVIVYDYQSFGQGEVILSSIRYNHRWDSGDVNQRRVVLNYEDRPDVGEYHLHGALYKSTQRLTSIETFVGDALIKRYAFSYQTSLSTDRSLLSSVTLCSPKDCLPATTFSYTASPGASLNALSVAPLGGWRDMNSSKRIRYLSFDYNLDGRTDLMQLFEANGTAQVSVWLKTDEGYSVLGGRSQYLGGWNDVGSGNEQRYLALDHNRDGRTDIVAIYQIGDHAYAGVALNNGAGFTPGPASNIGGWSDLGSAEQRRYLSFDATGDGHTDLIEIFQMGDYAYAHIWANTGTGFADGAISQIGGWSDVNSSKARRYLTMDANGDGLTDILELSHLNDRTFVSRWLSHGNGFSFGGNRDLGNWVNVNADNAHQIYPMDVNGDGLEDLILIYKAHDNTAVNVYWNTGHDFIKDENIVSIGAWQDHDSDQANRYLTIDVDGDGKTDLIKLHLQYSGATKQTWAEVYYGSNSGLVRGERLYIGGWFDTNADDTSLFYAVDHNGDGLAGIVNIFNVSKGLSAATTWQFHTRADQDQLSTITDGLGAQTRVTYAALSDPAVYTRDRAVDGEEHHPTWWQVTPSFQVVKQYQTQRSASANCTALSTLTASDNDTDDLGCYRFGYHYEEAVVDPERGLLGFKRITITDEQHQTSTTQTYAVRYPLSGQLLNSTVTEKGDAAKIIGIDSYSYQHCEKGGYNPHGHCNDLPQGAHRVFLDQQQQHHYSPGKHDYTLTTEYHYDRPNLSNGQPTAVIYHGDAPNGQGDGAYRTCYQFATAADHEHWKRSFVTQQRQTTWQSGGCTDISRAWEASQDLSWQQFSYDARMNRVRQQVYLDKTATAQTTGHWLATDMSYDSYGNRISEKASTGLITRYEYDAQHTYIRQITTDADGLTLTSHYAYEEGTGLQTQVTSPQGLTTRTIRDAMGRVIEMQQTDPGNPKGVPVTIATRRYKASSRQPGRIDVVTRQRQDWSSNTPTDWPATTQVLDSMGTDFETYTTAEIGTQRVTGDKTYNHKGQLNKAFFHYLGDSQAARGHYHQYRYDPQGRLSSVVSSFNEQTTEYHYPLNDARTVRKSVSSPEGSGLVTYSTTQNSRGKVITQTGPSGGITQYKYDLLNRLTQITDPLGQVRTLSYNSLGQKLSDHSNETGTTEYSYDSHGRLASQTDAAGRIVRFSYDSRNRLIARQTEHSGMSTATNYHYQANDDLGQANRGRLVKTTVTLNDRPVTQSEYRYNVEGRTIEHRYSMDLDGSTTLDGGLETQVFQFGYNAAGQMTALTYPDGTVMDFHHQANSNLLRQVSYDNIVDGVLQRHTLASYTDYHANGKAQSIRYGNGVTEQRQFDAIGRLQSTALTNGTTTLLSRDYQWNKANKITDIIDNTDAQLSQSFTYDPNGHLISAQGAYDSLAINYDLAGNRTGLNDDVYEYQTAEAKAHQLNQITSADGTQQIFHYDAAGYLTSKVSDGETLNYHWDGHGNLIRVNRGTGASELRVNDFVYNASNERIRKLDYDANGKLLRTTHYLPGLYEIVVDTSTGAKSYTNYLGGIAAKTEVVESQSTALNSIEDRILLNTGLAYASVMPMSLTQLNDWLTGVGLILAHNDLGARIIASILWASLVFSLVLFLAWQWLRHAPKASRLGQWRHRLLVYLVAMGWLSRRRARRWDTPNQQDLSLSLSRYCLVGLMCLCIVGNLLIPAYAAITPGVNGAGVPVAGQFLYLHSDQVASTTLVTSASGAVVSTVEYTPFGQIVDQHSHGTDNFRAKFAGKERDHQTGLSYFGQRYYDAGIGRFISPDPAAQYHSPYLYGANDPLTMIDPTGEVAFSIVAIVVASAIIAGYSSGAAVGGWDFTKWNDKAGAAFSIGFVIGGLSAWAGSGPLASVVAAKISSQTAAIIATEVALGALSGAADGAIITGLKGDGDWGSVGIGAAFGAAFGGVAGGSSARQIAKSNRRFARTAPTVSDINRPRNPLKPPSSRNVTANASSRSAWETDASQPLLNSRQASSSSIEHRSQAQHSYSPPQLAMSIESGSSTIQTVSSSTIQTVSSSTIQSVSSPTTKTVSSFSIKSGSSSTIESVSSFSIETGSISTMELGSSFSIESGSDTFTILDDRFPLLPCSQL